ncbi:hypothetical protein CJF42_07840 [Pseudoalteromonas sp. NBT06-2]|uniref:CUB domain-containing protein n=1 Tax=Pseudoalteromonas sp. NBT06-2 TaxID=2025950 RepID=UPI000BA76117|nr:CUB domain-containing protein [Pseudoalteromonas sp. NBT06-2]PAJ74976.1 hypothetical protein CJF42_07840 [Pseudoalteromonas sp. NBT06-2]
MSHIETELTNDVYEKSKMKAPLKVIRTILLFFVLVLVLPSAYGNTICNSSSSTNTTGTLTDSGGSSGDYDSLEECSFLIKPLDVSIITLTFSAFDLESTYDTLTIYDGSTTTFPILARYSGSVLPASVTSSGDTMLIHFSSDYSVNESGFITNWTATIASSFPAQSVADNFPSISYSQNSGSQNWSEVGESDGTSAGIVRVYGGLLLVETAFV